jgi:hypothetical protein
MKMREIMRLSRRAALGGAAASGLARHALGQVPGRRGSGPGVGGSAVYPVRVSANSRYLVDANNGPYLICCDSMPYMPFKASLADISTYLSTRRAQGYNAVWISMTADYTALTTTYDGIPIFTTPGDISTPNPAYFARMDAILALFGRYNICAFLTPIMVGGPNVSPSPNLALVQSNGIEKCFNFGVFLGNRYRNTAPIVWWHGNDYNYTAMTSVYDTYFVQLVNGIKSVDTNHIHTIEISHDDVSPALSTDDPTWASIVGLNLAYAYAPVYDDVLRGYNRSPTKPIYMGESWFEAAGGPSGVPSGVTPLDARKEAWWSNLSGATGQAYGNDYMWNLATGWLSHITDPGSVHVGYMQTFLTGFAWQTLVPDQSHQWLTAGYGTYATNGPTGGNSYVTCAATANLAIVYVPSSTTITMSLAKMAGATTARWFDPTTSGSYTAIAGSPFANIAARNFTSPGINNYGDPDWVLVLTT